MHTVRLFLHVLGATVWFGGQIVVGALMPTLRTVDPKAPALAARRFAMVAWPAYVLLLFTGIWNTFEIEMADRSTEFYTRFGIKFTAFLVSGAGAALHAFVKRRWAFALGGAMASIGAAVALFLGISLRFSP